MKPSCIQGLRFFMGFLSGSGSGARIKAHKESLAQNWKGSSLVNPMFWIPWLGDATPTKNATLSKILIWGPFRGP